MIIVTQVLEAYTVLCSMGEKSGELSEIGIHLDLKCKLYKPVYTFSYGLV